MIPTKEQTELELLQLAMQMLTPKQFKVMLATLENRVACFATMKDKEVRECWLPVHRATLELARRWAR